MSRLSIRDYIVVWFESGSIFTVTDSNGDIVYLSRDEAAEDFTLVEDVEVITQLDSLPDGECVAVNQVLLRKYFGVQL